MSKLLLITFTLLITQGYTQTKGGKYIQQGHQDNLIIHVDKNGDSYDWERSDPDNWVYGEFYWRIERTHHKNKSGFYRYTLYISSNDATDNKLSHVSDLAVMGEYGDIDYTFIEKPYVLVGYGKEYVCEWRSFYDDDIIYLEYDEAIPVNK